MNGYRYGGFWRRGIAMLIDRIIIFFIYLTLILLEFLMLPSSPYSHRPDTPAGIWNHLTGPFLIGHVILGLVIGMTYFTWFHGSVGQTPGKVLLKLKVIRTTGKNLNYGRAFLRFAGYIVSAIFLFLGFIWAAFDGRKQGWHDKLAGTVVVIVNNNGPRDYSV